MIDYRPEIAELRKFFNSNVKNFPETPFKLTKHETIIDAVKFIKTHLDMVEKNYESKYHEPYLNRLFRLKTIINNNRRKRDGIIKD